MTGPTVGGPDDGADRYGRDHYPPGYPDHIKTGRLRGDILRAARALDHDDYPAVTAALWPADLAEVAAIPGVIPARTAGLITALLDLFADRLRDAAAACPCGRPERHTLEPLQLATGGPYPAGETPEATAEVIRLARRVLRAHADGPQPLTDALTDVIRAGFKTGQHVLAVLLGGYVRLVVRVDCPDAPRQGHPR